MTNQEIILRFFHNDNLRYGEIKKLSKNEYNELFSIYPDSDHIKEVLWRIKRNIIERPKCKICGSRVKWKKSSGVTNEDCYYSTCSRKCGNILGQQHIRENCLEKYGCVNHNQRADVRDKFRLTILSKYGVEHALQIPESLNKLRKTNFERYGVDSFPKSSKCKEKYKNTCLSKYGATSFWQSDSCKQKFIDKYGVNNPVYVENILNKIKDWWNRHPEHSVKMRNGIISKYGKSNPMFIPEIVNKVKAKSKESKIKEYNTKKINGTLGNKSKQEDEVYTLLLNKFDSVIRQYKSDKYPFLCDFYIPKLDLYIECNFHWTHGGKPFNDFDEDCKEKLECWKLKSKESNFYINAINTWTIRDLNKFNIAKINNINYKVFYSKKEIYNWLNTF